MSNTFNKVTCIICDEEIPFNEMGNWDKYKCNNHEKLKVTYNRLDPKYDDFHLNECGYNIHTYSIIYGNFIYQMNNIMKPKGSYIGMFSKSADQKDKSFDCVEYNEKDIPFHKGEAIFIDWIENILLFN